MQTRGTDANNFFALSGHRIGEGRVAWWSIEGVDNGGVHGWLLRSVAWIIFEACGVAEC